MISIIVEWENAILAEASRGTRLLDSLGQQVEAVDEPLEVLVMVGDDRIDVQALEAHVARAGPAFRVVRAPGRAYYELKNFGAEQARGDPLVFVDSDVRVHDGWLEGILAPFKDPDVRVVAGHTHVEAGHLTGKAFAAFWFFPLAPDGEDRVFLRRGFFANNVAFRRGVFERYKFQPIPRSTRGGCRRLADALNADGVPIQGTTAARASHPPPNGARHLCVRALAQGRDDLQYARASGKRGEASLGRALLRIPKGGRSVFRRRRAVGLSWPATVPATLLAVSYNSLRAAGNAFARLFPGLAGRLWRI